ncbi:MAG: peptidylprolyl isomerase [Myxococcota bacterium]
MRPITLLSLPAALLAGLLLVACRSPEPNDQSYRDRRAAARSAAADPAGTTGGQAAGPGTGEEASPTGGAAADTQADTQEARNPALLDPSLANATAPATFTVKLETTEGDVLIDVTRAWAPLGADRFYNLVRIGALDDVAFFRVIEGFMAQVGLNGDPAVNRAWKDATIQDDPVTQSNTRGMVSFATSGPNSRVQQFFINFGNNVRLDGMGFSPFGRVRDMTVMDTIHSGYGEGAPRGRGPSQGRITNEGNTYLRAAFPELDYIRRATLVES